MACSIGDVVARAVGMSLTKRKSRSLSIGKAGLRVDYCLVVNTPLPDASASSALQMSLCGCLHVREVAPCKRR